ncbi:Dimethyladenosine transferase [Brettanomyces bruxellensis]|uniref:rRNA adenine N(6)-methyltransferase n=1 Tax=Dekkera bruxellensis TaxID=5007 RepID=A0A8H6ETR3_DEKBR|nr:Dimethyladenosine transferase [Brettanomyces bruxellensis]
MSHRMPKSARKQLGSRKTPSAANQINRVFKFNTNLGQHILKNPQIAQAIVDKAEIRPSDVVLEIGPGTGNLTMRILEKARKVIAIEVDPRMAGELLKRVQGTPVEKKLEITVGDFMKMKELPYFDVCISNTPYQISSGIVFRLLEMEHPPRIAVLMFQREFAMNLTARPGDNLYNRLSANAQMWANVKHVMKVGKNNFRPPPKVESSVVKVIPKIPRPNLNYSEWDGLLRLCFNRKNKTLGAIFRNKKITAILEENYKRYLAYTTEQNGDMSIESNNDVESLVKQNVNKVLTETGFAEQRASKMDQVAFLKLLYAFHQVDIRFPFPLSSTKTNKSSTLTTQTNKMNSKISATQNSTTDAPSQDDEDYNTWWNYVHGNFYHENNMCTIA